MQDFAIGLSGLNAAQAALEVVGNNVANAATKGYHRQQIELTPVAYGATGNGVDVTGVTRMVDTLLESEIMRQQSSQGQVSQELSLLSTVQTTFGEFSSSGGLNTALDDFFASWQKLAASPLDPIARNSTISSAQTLASEFQRLGASLQSTEGQVTLEAQNTVDSINALAAQIAQINGQITTSEVGRNPANNLRDQRDHLVAELAQLTGIETQSRDDGAVDVSIAGVPVVTGAISLNLGVHSQGDRSLAISAANTEGGGVQVEGGQLGGLLALENNLLPTIHTDLDTLAKTVINEVNRIHLQGVGQEGSFQDLTGSNLASTDLTALGADVTDGTFYVRVTNTVTGQVQRYAVNVNVSGATPDTPASLAAKIDAINGLSASINGSRLYVAADQGYTFDFCPAVLAQPTATHFTAGTPPAVTVSGLYSGAANHVFTFTVAGNGSVGNGNLQLNVHDETGNSVGTMSIGAGYAAGDTITLNNGLQIAVGTGQLNAGDSFQVQALATTDTSGFLAAAGMNAFFSGGGASEMQVSSDILQSPNRIATALGADLTDNACAEQLAALRDQTLDSLAGMTPSEYYQRLVADLGQQVSLKQGQQDNGQAVLQNLQQQRDDLSSVNINDEAAQLLVYQQMFQATAKYLTTIQTTMTTLMDMVGS
jgi:flagellar hook-associated protein 1